MILQQTDLSAEPEGRELALAEALRRYRATHVRQGVIVHGVVAYPNGIRRTGWHFRDMGGRWHFLFEHGT